MKYFMCHRVVDFYFRVLSNRDDIIVLFNKHLLMTETEAAFLELLNCLY